MLALAVTEHAALPANIQRFVVVLATGFVLFGMFLADTVSSTRGRARKGRPRTRAMVIRSHDTATPPSRKRIPAHRGSLHQSKNSVRSLSVVPADGKIAAR
jgi:hypothetical protein